MVIILGFFHIFCELENTHEYNQTTIGEVVLVVMTCWSTWDVRLSINSTCSFIGAINSHLWDGLGLVIYDYVWSSSLTRYKYSCETQRRVRVVEASLRSLSPVVKS